MIVSTDPNRKIVGPLRTHTMARILGVCDSQMRRYLNDYALNQQDDFGRYLSKKEFATFLKLHDMWNSLPAVCRYLWGLE